MPPALHFFHIYHYSVYYEIKCSLFENFTEVVLCLKWLFVALDSSAQNLDTMITWYLHLKQNLFVLPALILLLAAT